MYRFLFACTGCSADYTLARMLTEEKAGLRWEVCEADADLVHALQQELGVSRALALILANRGVTNREQADVFMSPRLSRITDPFVLPSMNTACDRIWQAIDNHERITIFGDYDVDGISSTALMVRVLSILGAEVNYFMPDRESEGYGLTEAALNRCLKEKGPSLLITVDCGTNSADEVAQAMDAGVDVIVTDHHEPGHTLAEPLALINPRLGQDVTQHVLAGVGVAFKVCHGLVKSGRTNNRPEVADLDLRRFLDIVAIGTVADMVPLLYDNRIFVRHGLSRCEASEWKGLRALIRKSDLTPPFESWHIGYMIGPRLNAAGRLGTAITSLALMLEDDTGEAMKRASELDLANTERRKIEQKMVEQAVKVLDERFDPLNDFSVVVASQTWHPGVIGIVASRLTKRYNRPSMVVAFDENGVGRGSCRGVEGFHLLDALDYCDDLLDTYGGHAMAAGLTVQREQYDTLKDMFNEACTFGLEGVDLRPALRLEGWLDPQEADMTFVRSMDACRPFGMANPQPVWGLKDLSIVGEVKTVGNGHLKLNLACGASEWEAIGFNMADRDIPDGPIDVAATLNVNAFQGRETLQLKLQDFRPAQ